MATFEQVFAEIAFRTVPDAPRVTTPILCERCREGRELNNDGLCADCAATLARGYEISSKAGRCRTGSDQTGEIYHARLLGDDGWPNYKAVCGTEPGRRSAGWSSWKPADREVTCKRCLKRLANKRLQATP